MKTCSICGHQFPDDLKECPVCGAPAPDADADANTTITATTFILRIPEGSNQAASQATIEIFDAYGRRVWSHESQASKSYLTKQWNVSDTSGTPLPAGIYLFRATMSGEGGKLKTATKKLIIR